VAFLGWYENHKHIFLSMEYVEGGDLSKYIAEGGPKPLLEVKDIAKQILEGLAILHSLKIYHRDLKPQVKAPVPFRIDYDYISLSALNNKSITLLEHPCGLS
jgi:tRNA A-37 threonylcarbamoyl transferase component Bud32